MATGLCWSLPSSLPGKRPSLVNHGNAACCSDKTFALRHRKSLSFRRRIYCAKKSEDEGRTTADEGLSTTVAEVAEKVVEVAENVVEAAAQSVSVVGEIEEVVPEESAIDKAAAIRTVVFWVTSAVAFGSFVGITEGPTKGSEFFAGYLLEQSLSVDNLFVFVLIFKYFQVPAPFQSRVLTYGIAGAVVFRATMILLGVATLQRLEAVNLLFAGVLLYSSYKLLTESEDGEDDLANNSVVKFCKKYIPVSSEYDGNNFFTTNEGERKATPLLLTLAVVELSDIAFAVDSIPAVFGVTRDPFIVFSSNMFAILGLRSLYTIVSSSMAELEYLQPAIAGILGFIGAKMILDFIGLHVPTEASLGIVAATLATGVSLSLIRKRQDDER